MKNLKKSEFMEFLKNFIKGRVKLLFKQPGQKDILVFDDVSFKDLRYLLEGKNYCVIPSRANRITEIVITKKFLVNFFKLFFYKKISLKSIFFTSYLVSVIQLINPKLIISHIDNSIKYSEISFFLKDHFNFLTVQNAARYDQLINELNFKKNLKFKIKNYKLFIQNFLCFGKFEEETYKKLDYTVENFHIIGSLRKSNFFRYLNIQKKILKPDLYKLGVLLEIPLETPGLLPDVKDEIYPFVLPIIYSIKYSKKKNIKPIFICKTKEIDEQLNCYGDYLKTDEINFIKENLWERRHKEFSSYEAIFQTQVLVGMASTLLREKISSKDKILSCNYSKSSFWNFPIQGICSLNEEGYQKFENRLDKVFSSSIEDYLGQLDQDHRYVCNQESNDQALKKIDDIIAKYIY